MFKELVLSGTKAGTPVKAEARNGNDNNNKLVRLRIFFFFLLASELLVTTGRCPKDGCNSYSVDISKVKIQPHKAWAERSFL